jgi:glycosyltransferase involved in cell wall biosynthesis
MNIVQICSARQPRYGAVIAMMTLARTLRSMGHQVSFIGFQGREFADYARQEGFDAIEVKVRTKIDPISVVQVARHLRSVNADVVQGHLSSACLLAGLAGRLAKVPSVSTVHGMSGKLSYVAAERLIAVSEGVRRHLISQGVPSTRISVVHNGIDSFPSPLTRDEACERLGLPRDRRYFGTTARLAPIKGINVAIEALSKLPTSLRTYDYVVAGDGAERDNLLNLAERLGVRDRVRLIGFVKEPETLLALLDLFVLPSLQEALSVSLLEAMDCSLPMVVSNVGGVPEVVDSQCAMQVPANDSGALAAAIAAVLADPIRRDHMSVHARKRFQEHFTADLMAISMLKIYQELLALRR